MKALILAAGLGTRLAPITESCPKTLVKVGGKAILVNQIEALQKNGVFDITVVAGYKAEVLKETVAAMFDRINVITNNDYACTNNMYSAYITKDIFYGEEFLMMNGDVFFDKEIIGSLLAFDAENAIAVDLSKYSEESMKVVCQNGVISHISKVIPQEEAYGCSIDVYKFGKQGGMEFFNKCEQYITVKKDLNKWSEVAINDILHKAKFIPLDIKGSRWLEIDNHDDLACAERLFADKS